MPVISTATGREAGSLGECHRYAPRPLVIPGDAPGRAATRWPVTDARDVCGEWYYGGERLATGLPPGSAGENAAPPEVRRVEEVSSDEVFPAS
jgi:hypothetical protein